MHSFEPQAHQPLEAELPVWGVSVLESHHASDFRTVMARHDFWQLLFVLRGAGTLRLEDRELNLAAGDAASVPPLTPHAVADAPGKPLSLYAVNIASRLLPGSPGIETLLEKPRRLRHPALPGLMPDTLRRLLVEQTLTKPGHEAMMIGLALQLVATLTRLQATPPNLESSADAETPLRARVETYVQDLERHFYKNETVDQVAARLGMSRRSFTELFRASTGSSWLPYVRNLRLEHSRRLLRESNRTVLSIAFECGFEDVSAFYRAFKTASGTSPDQWRRQNRAAAVDR
jgi:AraC family L-rhamnose operon regulatory protein RhaS